MKKKSILVLILVFMFAASTALAQTDAVGSISGSITDSDTNKPVPVSLVTAISFGLPSISRTTESAKDGSFQIEGLPAGIYSLCVQAPDDSYIDPCQWDPTPTGVSVRSAQEVTGVPLKLTPASILEVKVKDARKTLAQKTKDGRNPELSIGVWGPKGLFYPVHRKKNTAADANSQAGGADYSYQIAIPRDTNLRFDIASKDLSLGDETGAPLPGNASQQAFQHARGAGTSKHLEFTVLGLLP